MSAITHHHDSSNMPGPIVSIPTRAPDSATHHHVWRCADGWWLKVAGDHTPHASSKIAQETAVSRVLGRDIEAGVTCDGRAYLRSPNLGSSMVDNEHWTPALVTQLLARLGDYQHTRVPAGVLPCASTWAPRAIATARRRLDTSHPQVAAWCIARIQSATADLCGTTLTHTDPHLGNWVRDDATGVAHLLDWESAITAHSCVDIAAVWLACVLDNNDPAARTVLDCVTIDAAFVSAWRIKSAAATSWYAWYGATDEQIHTRIETLSYADSLL